MNLKPTEIGVRERTGGAVEIGGQGEVEEAVVKGGVARIDGLAGEV